MTTNQNWLTDAAIRADVLREEFGETSVFKACIRERDKWIDLDYRINHGEILDGRSSIYSGETYAKAAQRWQKLIETLAMCWDYQMCDLCSWPDPILDPERVGVTCPAHVSCVDSVGDYYDVCQECRDAIADHYVSFGDNSYVTL